MKRMMEKRLHRAICMAVDMLNRNSCPSDTFEGVLCPSYVRALRTLVGLGEQEVARNARPSRHTRRL